jgi:hypothetical protein
MDMNLSEAVPSIRLVLNRGDDPGGMVDGLKAMLKTNNIRRIFIRGNLAAGDLLAATGLLKDDFNVILECDAAVYASLRKHEIEKADNIMLLPVFDVGDNISRLKRIMALLPHGGPDASSIVISNEGKLTDKKRMTEVFRRIRKGIGGKNVKFLWDCGFALCSFQENELGYFIQTGSDIQCCCPSLASIDAQLNVHVCDRLCGLGGEAGGQAGKSLPEIMNGFEAALLPYRSFGIFSKDVRRGMQGGDHEKFPVISGGYYAEFDADK